MGRHTILPIRALIPPARQKKNTAMLTSQPSMPMKKQRQLIMNRTIP